ncbi:MAG: Transcriptional regulatory protein sin3 [Phylliscum demangeonii]|nr:MAG: Transcriptional regulatory protein sin3 [Phylliscum demangeonii]
MSASHPDGWAPSSLGPPGPPLNGEQHGQNQNHPRGLAFGPPGASHHAPYYASNQQGGHSIPALAGLAPQPQHPTSVHPSPAVPPQLSLQQPPAYSLPTLGPNSGAMDRDRDMRHLEMREREREREHHDRQRQQDAVMLREREQQEREMRDRQHRESFPAQHHTGSIPIHQPVASKVSTAIHGPGGLLSSIGPASGSTASGSLGHATAAGLFGNALQAPEGPARTLQPMTTPSAPQHPLPFGNAHAVHPMASGGSGLSQGQQPILNDALSYLDQVKVQFVDQPDVYNRFLDIMKDFKSQAIDTPGVIERVSNLFAGHPNLIQGFNTFLPPGYRIECGTGDDPNAIRVTTPMGTTVSSMPAALRPPSTPSNGLGSTGPAPPNARPGHYYEPLPRNPNAGWPPSSHPSAGLSDGVFGPPGRANPLTPYSSPAHPPGPPSDAPMALDPPSASALSLHPPQPDQGGLSQSPGVALTPTALPHGSPHSTAGRLAVQLSAAQGGGLLGSLPISQGPLDRKGPVEFNHAISYVNKIKNRFANQPDIYKQFLEILQTYQRESKPIQDVYAQVTHLFNAAPDLLEDFKQFLPESAAHAKAQAAAKQAAEDSVSTSHVRADAGHVASILSTPGALQTPGSHRTEIRMPPVGNFAPPPSVGKENKKKRTGAGAPSSQPSSAQTVSPFVDANPAGQGSRTAVAPGGGVNKRAKLNHNKSVLPDMVAVSPTLTPALPEPIPPTPTYGATTEEIAFFDRVKKFIGNKQTFNEFLKLCNLFTQDLIDRAILVYRASSFIGGNPELITWFQRFVGHNGSDEVIENKPKPPANRVNLANCRGYGPSYRLLPKREREKTCDGRDELCHAVLNDEWASHPTWASEDSGFTSHKKNGFEDALHRVEEERHEYDFTIGANLRTIQLLEPIALNIARMSPEERATFRLSPGLGGQSTAIYQRAIKKVYGAELGQSLCQDMLQYPCAVVPVVLCRLKQKDVEWRTVQREYEKVWRELTTKNYWKSLDHMGVNTKTADKKQFTSKTLINEIATAYEEQRTERGTARTLLPAYQLAYTFDQPDVVLDAICLLLVHVGNAGTFTSGDRQKLQGFLRDFSTNFFGISTEQYDKTIGAIAPRLQVDEDMSDAANTVGDTSPNQGRGGANGRKPDLLRGVLDRNRGNKTQDDGKANVATRSKESTPDIGSTIDDGDGGPDVNMEATEAAEPSEENWTQHPAPDQSRRAGPVPYNIPPNQPFRRDNFSLYCGGTIYGFFRTLQFLYERLLQLKQYETSVTDDVRRARTQRPADALSLVERTPQEYFPRTDPDASHYAQVLELIMDVTAQRAEMAQFEEVMRRHYLQSGWKLYSFDKLFSSVARFALAAASNDGKEKNQDLVLLFAKDRQKSETTYEAELTYRKHAERLVKDTEIYRIEYNQINHGTTIQILRREDATFNEGDMSPEARWSYYVASFIKVEPTEGVPIEGRLNMPFLRRNLPEDIDELRFEDTPIPIAYENNLELRICVNTYKILYGRTGLDWFIHPERQNVQSPRSARSLPASAEERTAAFREKFVGNNTWIQQLDPMEVEEAEKKFRASVEGRPDHRSHSVDPESASQADPDEIMTDAAAAATDS